MKPVTPYIQTPKGYPYQSPMDEVIFNIVRMERNPLGILLSAIRRLRREEQKTRDFYETGRMDTDNASSLVSRLLPSDR